MRIYAHRGSSGVRPENSLAAFEQAIVDGADGVELDVRATADGVPVVLHDRDLGRTTGRGGAVDALTLAELRHIDAGDGRPVPTLAEVLELLGGRMPLDIEVKQAGTEGDLLTVLGRYPATEWVVSAFEWDVLRAVRARSAAARLWPLAIAADDALFEVAEELGAEAVALLAPAVVSAVVGRCRAAGLGVMAWTVDEAAEGRRLRGLGVDVLCTNRPAAMRRALAEGKGGIGRGTGGG